MEKKEIDADYRNRLEELYKLSVEKVELGTAVFILEKIRNLNLYLHRPVEEEKKDS